MENLQKLPAQESKNAERLADLDVFKNKMRVHLRDNVIRLKELREKARAAEGRAWRKIQEAQNKGFEGAEFRGEHVVMNPKEKAGLAIASLKKETLDAVSGHGIASNRQTQDRDFPINALVNILATGVLKGDSAPLSGGINQAVFTDAPFILLSNRGERLTEPNADGTNRLKGLRTVLVNGEYEGVVDELRKAFPWVSFRTAEQLDDAVFERKEPAYRSYEDQLQEIAIQEEKKRQTVS